MRRSVSIAALLPLVMSALAEHAYYPPSGPRRRRDDDREPERKPTGPSKEELKYQATADAIRAERLKRKAENFAKRQPKVKPS